MSLETTLSDSVFLDQSAFIAYINPDDSNHEIACNYFLELDDLDRNFATTNLVVFTIHQWLRDHFGYEFAEFYLNVIDKSVHTGKLSIIPSSAQLEERARQFLLKCADYEITLEEAFNLVVISDYEIRRIFSFNRRYHLLEQINAKYRVIPTITAS